MPGRMVDGHWIHLGKFLWDSLRVPKVLAHPISVSPTFCMLMGCLASTRFCNSPSSLQSMLNCLKNYSRRKFSVVNAEKSVIVCFDSRRDKKENKHYASRELSLHQCRKRRCNSSEEPSIPSTSTFEIQKVNGDLGLLDPEGYQMHLASESVCKR